MSRAALVRAPRGAELDVERAASILAGCKDVERVKDMADRAAAIGHWLRSQKASLQAQNDAAEIMIRSQRRLGELLREMPKALGARNVGKSGGSKLQPPKLADQGIEKTAASRWQKLAKVPEPVFEQHVAAVRARAQKLTTSGAISATSHAATYDSDEWYTPEHFIDAASEVLGEIDLDPASSEKAQETVRAKAYWTKKDDALDARRVWRGRVWMNPPYSAPLASLFVMRLLDEHAAGRVTRAICLMNASTDTAWFHALARAGSVCLTAGRIAFLDPRGRAVQGNRVGQAFFCLGDADAHALFAARFAQYGLVGRLRGADA